MIALSPPAPQTPEPRADPRRARRDSSAPIPIEPETSAPAALVESRLPRGTPAAGLPRVSAPHEYDDVDR